MKFLMTILAAMFAALPAAAQTGDIPTAPADAIDLSIGFGAVRRVSDLSEYISLFYTWMIGAGAVVAAVVVTIGGFQYIASAGSPKMVGQAKTRIVNSLIGLVLLMGSYVLLYSINPDFANLKLPEIRTVQRIELVRAVSGCADYVDQSRCEADIGSVSEDGCRWIRNTCVDANPAQGTVGGPCLANGTCGSAKFCLSSLTNDGLPGNVCTDGKPGSPCNPFGDEEDLTAYGCIDPQNFTCNQTTKRCEAKVKIADGQNCRFNGFECQSGYCDASKICRPQAERPEQCTANKTCATTSLWCCADTEAGVCDEEDAGICLPQREAGDVCISNAMCANALCNLEAKTCFAAIDEACSRSSECMSGNCVSGKCAANTN